MIPSCFEYKNKVADSCEKDSQLYTYIAKNINGYKPKEWNNDLKLLQAAYSRIQAFQEGIIVINSRFLCSNKHEFIIADAKATEKCITCGLEGETELRCTLYRSLDDIDPRKRVKIIQKESEVEEEKEKELILQSQQVVERYSKEITIQKFMEIVSCCGLRYATVSQLIFYQPILFFNLLLYYKGKIKQGMADIITKYLNQWFLIQEEPFHRVVNSINELPMEARTSLRSYAILDDTLLPKEEDFMVYHLETISINDSAYSSEFEEIEPSESSQTNENDT